MSWQNKVIWSEGLFLRPQHLQQSDRYVEKLVRDRTGSLRGYGWGFTELKLNRDLLKLGKVAILSARGVMRDGTPFGIPEDADHPPPYEVPTHARNQRIYLALPLYQPGAVEVDARPNVDVPVRYRVSDQDLLDTNAGERDAASVEVGRLAFALQPEDADRGGFTCLPVAHLVEVRADRMVLLDDQHIPPVLDCAAAHLLSGIINEVHGLLHHRGTALAARVGQTGSKGVAEIADFLLLQTINRYEPAFSHLSAADTVHPEHLFELMLQLCGELATYARSEKRPPVLGSYDHDDLSSSFRPVVESVRASLNAVLDQTAIPIPLKQHKYGVQIAEIADRSLLTNATFVLVVRADVEVERLRRAFPTQLKIGSADKIKELVNVALPGIVVNPLPVAPRQIPYVVGVSYFELDQQSPYWRDIRQTGLMAMHVAGDFPNLEIALWAIRGS